MKKAYTEAFRYTHRPVRMKAYKDRQDKFYILSKDSNEKGEITVKGYKVGEIMYRLDVLFRDSGVVDYHPDFFAEQHNALVKMLGLEVDRKRERHHADERNPKHLYITMSETNMQKLLNFYAFASSKEDRMGDVEVCKYIDNDKEVKIYRPFAVNDSWKGDWHTDPISAMVELIEEEYYYKDIFEE